MSDANRTAIRYIEETNWGETPATPAMIDLRITGESLTHAKSTVISDEINATRQVADMVKVGANASGELKAELNYSDFQAFIAAALFAEDFTTLAFSGNVGINHTTGVVTATAGDFDDAIVGASYRIAGSSTPANDGIKRVIAKANDGSTLTFAAGSFTATTVSDSITIDGKAAANGLTKRSFSVEREIPKTDGTGSIFQVFRGMTPDTLSLAVESMKIVQLNIGFVGKISATGTTSIAATNVAAGTLSPINGTNNFGTLQIDGATTTQRFKSINLAIKNNLRPQDALGEEGAFDLGVGRFELTGSASVYLENKALIDDFIAHTSRGLSFRLIDPQGTKTICINIPRVQLGKADGNATAVNTDVMLALDFTAIKDPTTGKTAIISFLD